MSTQQLVRPACTYRAFDVLSADYIGQLPYYGVNFGRSLPPPGSFAGVIKASDAKVQQLPYLDANHPSRTMLVIDYLGVPLWAGMIWNRNRKKSTSEIQVGGNELTSYFAHRTQQGDYSTQWATVGADAVTIAKQIVSDALNVATIGGGITIQVNDQGGAVGSLVNPTYSGVSLQTLQSIVDTLATQGLGAGFDYTIDVVYATGTFNPIVTLNFWFPRAGRTVDQTNLRIGNALVLDYEYPEDATQQATDVTEMGGGSGTLQENLATNLSGYPRLDRTFSKTWITDPGVLAAAAFGDAAAYMYPPIAPRLWLPLPRVEDGEIVPGTGWDPGGFQLGDDVTWNIDPVTAGLDSDPLFPEGMSFEWRIQSWQMYPEGGGNLPPYILLTLGIPPVTKIPPPQPPGTGPQVYPIPPGVTVPTNQVPPIISGGSLVGQQVTTTNGVWGGSPAAYAYQWFSNGSAIAGQTGPSYVLTNADIGTNTITVVVTATNAADPAGVAESSAPWTVRPVGGPTNSVAPTITGTLVVGSTLTATPGTWGGASNSYTYQWFSAGVAVGGATNLTYMVQASDAGNALTFVVTATNLGGTASASSLPATIGVAKTATLIDTFPGTVLDAQWVQETGVPATVGSNILTVPCDISYSGVGSVVQYDLTASTFFCAVTPPAVGDGTKQTIISLNAVQAGGNNDWVGWEISDAGGVNTCIPQLWEAGTQVAASGGIAWSSSTIGLRVREAAGTMYWDYSSDGVNWTNLYSLTYTLGITELYPLLFSGYFGTNAASNAQFSDINTAISGTAGVLPYNNAHNGLGTGWTLQFRDEFSGSALDETKWARGWYANNPDTSLTPPVNTPTSACYAPGNVTVANNCLNMAMTAGSYVDQDGNSYSYAGSFVSTAPSQGWGGVLFDIAGEFYVEVSMACPQIPGEAGVVANWPAFWLQGINSTGVAWPTHGEIDVAEGAGTMTGHWHGPSPGAPTTDDPFGFTAAGDFTNTFHTYGMKRDSGGGITWYYDGVIVFGPETPAVLTTVPFMLMIQNQGVSPGYATTPGTVQVDYVRVWN